MLEMTSFAAATGLVSKSSAVVAIVVVFGAACAALFDMQGVWFVCSSHPPSFHWQDGPKEGDLRGD